MHREQRTKWVPPDELAGQTLEQSLAASEFGCTRGGSFEPEVLPVCVCVCVESSRQ